MFHFVSCHQAWGCLHLWLVLQKQLQLSVEVTSMCFFYPASYQVCFSWVLSGQVWVLSSTVSTPRYMQASLAPGKCSRQQKRFIQHAACIYGLSTYQQPTSINILFQDGHWLSVDNMSSPLYSRHSINYNYYSINGTWQYFNTDTCLMNTDNDFGIQWVISLQQELLSIQ